MIDFHVTFESGEDARELARAALEARLAACVNIIDGMKSLFWWEGAIQEEAEVLAIFKTSAARADALAAFIAEHHPYDTPAIMRHDAIRANDDFERWIEDETGSR